jgi:hypothetical protein
VTASSPATKSGWKKAKVHTVTLPSGVQVEIIIPNLAKMAKGGELPNDLIKHAAPEPLAPGAEPTPPNEAERLENLKTLAEFQSWLVSSMLVSPKLDPDEVLDVVPTPDLEVLVELASRRRDMDVVGHHIGGLEVSAEWRKFRGIDVGDADLLDE